MDDHDIDVSKKLDRFDETLTGISDPSLRAKLEKDMDDIVGEIYRENSYYYEKYYREGFKDGMQLMLECIG